jgi:hypothetical protein
MAKRLAIVSRNDLGIYYGNGILITLIRRLVRNESSLRPLA